MNFIDEFVGFFNPEAGRLRMASRKALELQKRMYEGAAVGRRMDDWKTTGTDANAEIGMSLYTLRNRSRDAVRNNVYARRAVQAIANNVVGTGIVPSPIGLTRVREKQVMNLWKWWANSSRCNFDGPLNFYGIEWLVMKSLVESGGVLVVRRRENDKTVPMSVQVLEADFIDLNKDQTTFDGKTIIQGIEYDSNARVIAYWLFDEHPGSGRMRSLQSKRVEAKDVAYCYLIERPGQAHGVPWSAATLKRMKDFDDFEDAELMRQKIAACFAIFVQDQNPDSPGGVGTQAEDIASRVEPGIIEHLPPGKTVQFGNPPTTNGHESYARKQLQGISAGWGITYEMLTGDYSNVNFSSGRMGWIEIQRNIQQWQSQLIIGVLCDKVWGWFMEAVQLSGKIRYDVTVEWTPPRREMIDPVKETLAMLSQVRGGFKSWQEAVRESGQDPDTVIEEMIADFAKFDLNGIILDSDPRQGKTPVVEEKEEKDTEDTDNQGGGQKGQPKT